MKITIETDGHYKTTAECNGIEGVKVRQTTLKIIKRSRV